jgi:hypothetical protein
VPDEHDRDEEDEDLGQGALAVGGGTAHPRGGRGSGGTPPVPGGSGSAGHRTPTPKTPTAKTPTAKTPTAKTSAPRAPVPTAPGAGPAGGTAPARGGRGSRKVPDQRGTDQRDQPGPGRDDGGGDDPERTRGRRGRTHPIVPSWEDVLLGVRSPRS